MPTRSQQRAQPSGPEMKVAGKENATLTLTMLKSTYVAVHTVSGKREKTSIQTKQYDRNIAQ